MRKVIAVAMGAAFVIALAAPALAKTETVKGHVVDVNCYTKDMKENADPDHKMPADVKGCATACAKKGAPMAVLTADGKVYQLTGDLAADNNAKIVPHVGHSVEVTGDVTEKDGKMMLAASAIKHLAAQ